MTSVLALDIGGTKLAAAIVEAGGRVRDCNMLETKPEEGAEAVLERALDLADKVRAKQHGAGRPCALGVSTKGLTREDGVVASGMPGWADLRIPSRLRQRFPGLYFSTINDVKAGTLAEMRWGALRGVSDGLYVNLGTGVAAGIVVDGRLAGGAHGVAGEIGYIIPSMDVFDRQERLAPQVGTELPALLEAQIGGGAVPSRTAGELGVALSMEQLMRRSAEDEMASALLARIFCEIAVWIVNVALVVDPERVVIGGGFMRSEGELCAQVHSVLQRYMPFPPDAMRAHFGADSALVGAAACALRSLEQTEGGLG